MIRDWKLGLLGVLGIGIGLFATTKRKQGKEIYEDAFDDFDPVLLGRSRAAEQQASNRFKEKYRLDLERFGTRQGVINVSNDEGENRKEQQVLSHIERQGKALARKLRPKAPLPQLNGQRAYSKFYEWLEKSFDSTQVTLSNNSDVTKTIRLWGANRGLVVAPPVDEEVESHEVIRTLPTFSTEGRAVQPQGVAFNPFNGFAYITGQLSNNVLVMAPTGEVIKYISLEPKFLPGMNSPVALAINTRRESPNYGQAYVVGSVSNTVSVISTGMELLGHIGVGARPVAIAFDGNSGNVYTADLVGGTVSVIHGDSLELLKTIAVGGNPITIAVEPASGDAYIAFADRDKITVLDKDGVEKGQLDGIGQRPMAFAHNPSNGKMYVLSGADNVLTPVDTGTLEAGAPIPVGKGARQLFYNSNNRFIYVGNTLESTYTIVAPDNTVRATLPLGIVGNGLGFGAKENAFITTDPFGNQVTFVGYAGESRAVSFDKGLAAKTEDFQHNPAIVQHAKFVFSDKNSSGVLRLLKRNATGSVQQAPLSFSDYQGPQNFQNVTEVWGLRHTLIDGQHEWGLTLAPRQTLTIIIYYKQFEQYSLLPETAKRSTGVEMSKGEPFGLDRGHFNNTKTK